MSTAAEQMEAVVTAVAATVGIDPALIWPPGLHSLPVYVALWLGTMSILLFWYAFPKLPAQAEKQQAASKDFKLAALQNLLTAEKELEKEGAGSKDGADAQKLYDMLFDDVEQQPVTCLGIKADHPAFADTLALLKSRVNEELKQTVRKTRVALGSEAAEDGDMAVIEHELVMFVAYMQERGAFSASWDASWTKWWGRWKDRQKAANAIQMHFN